MYSNNINTDKIANMDCYLYKTFEQCTLDLIWLGLILVRLNIDYEYFGYTLNIYVGKTS